VAIVAYMAVSGIDRAPDRDPAQLPGRARHRAA
jgi:hypothetical protein